MKQQDIMSVIVTPPSYRASGGVVAGLQLSRALANLMPYTATLMSDATSTELGENGLEIRRFACDNELGMLGNIAPKPLQTAFIRSEALLSFIEQRRPSLVHIHNPHPARALCAVATTCNKLGIPYVISSHGFVEFSDPSAWLRGSFIHHQAFNYLVNHPFRKALQTASAVFLTSPAEHQVADKLQIPAQKRFIVTNGFNQYFDCTPTASELDNVRDKFRIDKNTPTFFFLGNHTPNKGIDTLIGACHLAKKKWRLIVGGALRSQAEHDRFRQEYKVDALGERIVFTDFLSSAELRSLYHSVDVFVFPSRSDTLPLVILDAMVSGLPVLASKVGGIPFQIDESVGRLVAPNDSPALAAEMDALASSPEVRRQLGAAACRKAHQIFDWNKSAKDAVAAYAQVLGGPIS